MRDFEGNAFSSFTTKRQLISPSIGEIIHVNSVGLSVKEISFAMGHIREVQDQNYARFIPTDVSKKFAKQFK